MAATISSRPSPTTGRRSRSRSRSGPPFARPPASPAKDLAPDLVLIDGAGLTSRRDPDARVHHLGLDWKNLADHRTSRGLDRFPCGVLAREREERPPTCVNIGPRSAPGSFGSWIFAPRTPSRCELSCERGLVMKCRCRTWRRRVPHRSARYHAREVRAETELATDRPVAPLRRARAERVGDRVGDRPVVLVSCVERRHVVRLRRGRPSGKRAIHSGVMRAGHCRRPRMRARRGGRPPRKSRGTPALADCPGNARRSWERRRPMRARGRAVRPRIRRPHSRSPRAVGEVAAQALGAASVT